MTKEKIAAAAAGLLLTAFAAWNGVWYLHYRQYQAFRDKTEKVTVGGMDLYQTSRDGYLFSVSMPSYLHFNGNLSADKTIPGNTQSEITMIVWLSLFGADEYGVILNTPDGLQSQIYLDRQGNPVFEDGDDQNYKDDVQFLVSENQEIIRETYDAWDTVFGIREK